MKIGILIDGGAIARWQLDALRTVAEGNSFIVFDCTNHRPQLRRAAHGAYYALNLLTIRNPQTRTVPVPVDLPIVETLAFHAAHEGAWESLPDELLDRIAALQLGVIVKFGMGLLRVPPRERIGCPILSYHHGDPRRFRGRPAGFYEMLSGESQVGQIVQILSNALDAGKVVAYAETKAYNYSYRKTLMEAFRRSPLLLRTAIDNALAGRTLPFDPEGRNFRLPSNALVTRFCAGIAGKKVERAAYGGLFEKSWKVARAAVQPGWTPEGNAVLPEESRWQTFPLPSRYRFLADPFFENGGPVLAEAMRRDGRGEIARLRDGGVTPLQIAGGHLSYPATIQVDGRQFLLPEMAEWSAPHLFELHGDEVIDRGELDIDSRLRLLDPTPYATADAIFLFANRLDEGEGVLRLWIADSLFAHFAEHPASPVRISPAGARMGGSILERQGKLFRFGQDLRGRYGDGLIAFSIEEISATAYRETQCGEIRFANHRGPHTLNFHGDTVLFDYYDERLSPLAGVRRLQQRLTATSR
jgi:hypothetical protein